MVRQIMAIIAAASMFALAGCVAIPSSGGVQLGPLIDDPDNPAVEFVASGPQDGASQEEILAGFMQAVRAPQSNYAAARLFFTKTTAATWEPDAGTLIRSGPAITTAEGLDTLMYTVTTAAYVDDQGRYTEPAPATQSLSFGFAKQDDQWRISSAPPGIVLTRSSFNVVFTEQSLYFFDPSYRYLIPDTRWFAQRSTVASRAVAALLAGPSPWLLQAAVTAFPKATALDSVSVESARAVVDFSTEVLASTPDARDRMRQQLVATLGVANIDITAGGIEVPTPEASGGDAVIPVVDRAVLIGTGAEFGFNAGAKIAPIPALSEAVVGAQATAASLAQDKLTMAFLAGTGVSVITSGFTEPVVVDERPGLIRPSIDPFRFVWSAQSSSAASVMAFDLDRTSHLLQSGLPADAAVVSMAVSRDGARLLLCLSSPLGSSLVVAGIIRQDNVPVRLGDALALPTPPGTLIDAGWADENSVATVSSTGAVTLVHIGGSTEPLGTLQNASTIAGGTGGRDDLRVLSGGKIWRPQGSGWVSTGISAAFLATKN
ncbi:MAG: LpqB family beta-propeller domain-containing protein [Rhodoglobus sp.]